MFTYFKMKKAEWKVKYTFYNLIAFAIDNQKDIVGLLSKLYTALKDTPIDEFQAKIITELSHLIHEQAEKDRKKNKSTELINS